MSPLRHRVKGLVRGPSNWVALGGTSSRDPDGRYTDIVRFARSRGLLTAAAAGKSAIDGVLLAIEDKSRLRLETDDAVRSGFAAMACIDPEPLQVVRETFIPSPEQVRWAQQVVERAASETGAFRFDGRMVNEPLLAQGCRLLLLDHARTSHDSKSRTEHGTSGDSVLGQRDGSRPWAHGLASRIPLPAPGGLATQRAQLSTIEIMKLSDLAAAPLGQRHPGAGWWGKPPS